MSPSTTAEPTGSPLATEEPASSLTVVDDSIVGIIPAADIDEDGQPIDPGFSFSADAPQITIVVQAGKSTGSPMDLTWFQLPDAGEQVLFTHTVQVASFQTAYSVGTNPGTLAAGTYRVDVAFEGDSRSTQFDVDGRLEPPPKLSLEDSSGRGHVRPAGIGRQRRARPKNRSRDRLQRRDLPRCVARLRAR